MLTVASQENVACVPLFRATHPLQAMLTSTPPSPTSPQRPTAAAPALHSPPTPTASTAATPASQSPPPTASPHTTQHDTTPLFRCLIEGDASYAEHYAAQHEFPTAYTAMLKACCERGLGLPRKARAKTLAAVSEKTASDAIPAMIFPCDAIPYLV